MNIKITNIKPDEFELADKLIANHYNIESISKYKASNYDVYFIRYRIEFVDAVFLTYGNNSEPTHLDHSNTTVIHLHQWLKDNNLTEEFYSQLEANKLGLL